MIKVKHLKRKNPKDEEFLELVKVKKEPRDGYYRYKVYYRNEWIAQFEMKKDSNHIWEMEIFEDDYKRRGLGMFIRKYIENDLGIKIVPSKYLTREGKLFYGIKPRTNPTDKEFLKTIFIEKDYDDVYHTIEYYIYRNEDNSKRDRFGKLPRALSIASAYYDTKDKWVYDLATKVPYQRKGLATYLYDYIEKDNKIKLKPSDYLLGPGKAFWKNRLK